VSRANRRTSQVQPRDLLTCPRRMQHAPQELLRGALMVTDPSYFGSWSRNAGLEILTAGGMIGPNAL